MLNKENCQKYLVKNDEMADVSSVKAEKVEEKKTLEKKTEEKKTLEKKIVKDIEGFSKQYNLSRHQKRESHKLKTNLSDISLVEA